MVYLFTTLKHGSLIRAKQDSYKRNHILQSEWWAGLEGEGEEDGEGEGEGWNISSVCECAIICHVNPTINEILI